MPRKKMNNSGATRTLIVYATGTCKRQRSQVLSKTKLLRNLTMVKTNV